MQRSFHFQSRGQNEKPVCRDFASTHCVSLKLFVRLLWLAWKQLPCRLASINRNTRLFLLFIIYCVPTAFSVSRVKRIDPFNKTGTTALSACPHPNLKIIPSIFWSAYLNVFVLLSWRQCIEHSFSLNLSFAIIFPAGLILLTNQCRVWIRWFCEERWNDSVSLLHCQHTTTS